MVMTDRSREKARRRAVDGFARARFGLPGTLRLHRHALGLDLIRAPVNVALSPVFLLTRLTGWLLGAAGLRRGSDWLAGRRIFLPSDVGRRLTADLRAFLTALQTQGLLDTVPEARLHRAVASYTETRNAVAEITTSLIVLVIGLALFGATTPGVISLAGPVAEMRAQAQAIDDFALGSGLGRVWNGLFPARPGGMQIVLTGAVLAVLASLVTAFAGVLADPLQLWTGIHRRRLIRLLDRLEADADLAGLEREHLFARSGDLADAALTLWRNMRP